MKTLPLLSLVALGLGGAAFAQTPDQQTQGQQSPDPSSSTHGQGIPSTSQTEGTAADRTPPGQTDTSGATRGGVGAGGTSPGGAPTGAEADPDTATSTAPAPGTSRSRMAAAGGAKMGGVQRASHLIGMHVQSPQGEQLGQVQDVIIDANGKVTHAIVERTGARDSTGTTGGASTTERVALPWDTVHSMMQGHTIVLDRSRLDGAPKFDESTLTSGGDWNSTADSYWRRQGTSRSAEMEQGGMHHRQQQHQQQSPTTDDRG